MNKNKCKGIFGFLFGHKFEAVYDTFSEYHPAEEKEKILASIGRYNVGAWAQNCEISPTPDYFIIKKQKTYKGHFCKRCGKSIKDEKTV